MSLEQIERETIKLIENSSPRTISLRGAWGVGKTFAWKSYIEKAKQDGKKLNFSRYAYVSLFGVDSLEDLKFQIFQHAVPPSLVGEEITVDSFRTHTKELSESLGRKWLQNIFGLPYLTNLSKALQSVAFLSVRNWLICIDDLERKGSNLALSDVLGLVSLLKEEKNCRVTIIHNDDALDGNDRKEFYRFREKVIDTEFAFVPTPKESASIAFKPEDKVHKTVIEYCLRLGIVNIRVLKKIENLSKHLIPYLDKYEPEIARHALHTLCLYTWCFYSDNNISPAYKYVSNIGLRVIGLEDDDSIGEREKTWNTVLQNYGYGHTSEFDVSIGTLVERGYVVENELVAEAEKMNERVVATRGKKSLEDAWDVFHNSFKDNGDQVVQELLAAFEEWTAYVTPNELHALSTLLRSLREKDLADRTIEHYISVRKAEIDLFNLEKNRSASEYTDTKLIGRFNETFSSNVTRPSLAEVVRRIAGKDGWSQEDMDVMASAEIKDYFEFFKSIESNQLTKYVNTCLQFRRIANATEQQKNILSKAIQALHIIGNENAINRARVRRFGIDVGEKTK